MTGNKSDVDCLQFLVVDRSEENSRTYVLHQDEVDIVGMCDRQFNCSVQVKSHSATSFLIEISGVLSKSVIMGMTMNAMGS